MRRMARDLSLTIALLFSLLLCSCSGEDYSSIDFSKEMQEVEWNWIPYDSDALRITGRGDFGQGDFVVLMWSGSAVTVGFEGGALEAVFWVKKTVYLDVFVDGEEEPSSIIKLSFPDDNPTTVPVVSGLPYGPHTVTLYKRSESSFGEWCFYGMRVLGEAQKSALPPPPEHKIEFIGNSITCGSDVLTPTVGGEFDMMYQDAYYGYAGQVAKNLGAEAHIICSSGHGVSVNFDGTRNNLIPDMYGLTGAHSSMAVEWDHSQWRPDVIVINLGTNDFASGKVDSALFVNATVDFIRQIRSIHPEAKVVMLDGPMLGGVYMIKCREFLDIAKGILEALGETDLYRFSFEPKGESPYGYYYHPTKDEAAADAKLMSAWMRSEFGWN